MIDNHRDTEDTENREEGSGTSRQRIILNYSLKSRLGSLLPKIAKME